MHRFNILDVCSPVARKWPLLLRFRRTSQRYVTSTFLRFRSFIPLNTPYSHRLPPSILMPNKSTILPCPRMLIQASLPPHFAKEVLMSSLQRPMPAPGVPGVSDYDQLPFDYLSQSMNVITRQDGTPAKSSVCIRTPGHATAPPHLAYLAWHHSQGDYAASFFRTGRVPPRFES